MKIAVLGASGQLGRFLCRVLAEKAIPLPRSACDISDRAQLHRMLADLRPSVVINTAAYTEVDRAETDVVTCQAVNVKGVANLAAVCRDLDCTLMHISSDYVFGGDCSRTQPYDETDLPAPLSVYGQSKLDSELPVRELAKYFIVRSCGLYCDDENSSNFVNTMLRLAAQRESVQVVNDQRCTPTYIPHLCRALLFLLETEAYGTYHITNTGSTTWCELAQTIFQLANVECEAIPIPTAHYATPARRPNYSVLDITKYQHLAGPVMPSWHKALQQRLTALSGERDESA
jgi:dTDP-4-dehydrorhamnose reductase